MFVHTVYFWLKPDAGDNRAAEIIQDCEALLSNIPGVRHLWPGRPAMTMRDVVDNSYDVGLCVVFDDSAGHDLYATHPQHLEFLNRHRQSWGRIQVYDFQP